MPKGYFTAEEGTPPAFHRQRPIRKRLEHSLVARHQRDGQRSSERDELGVVSRQRAAGDNVEHKIVGDDVFALGKRLIGDAQYSDDLRAREQPAPEIRRQHVT